MIILRMDPILYVEKGKKALGKGTMHGKAFLTAIDDDVLHYFGVTEVLNSAPVTVLLQNWKRILQEFHRFLQLLCIHINVSLGCRNMRMPCELC